MQLLDLSGIQTRDDMFAMRQRMEQRGANLEAARAAATAPPPPPPQPAAQPNSVESFSRCRSLKDRVHDRMVRGYQNSHPTFLPPPLVYEGTKDMYSHEMPFPVKTVYEVQTLPNPSTAPIETRSGYRPETLLLAAESAALVQTLEDRLGHALHRIANLENELDLERTQKDTLTTKLMIADKEILAYQARNDELLRQAEAIRRECQDSIDALKIAHGNTVKDIEAGERKAGADAVKKVQQVGAGFEGRVQELLVDKKRLEELVSELRNQLAQNATSLQVSTQTVRQLTTELLQAKQQSTFVSSGYKKIETDLRAANALIVAKDTELTVTRKATKDLVALTDVHDKTAKEHAEMKEKLAKLQGAEVENKKLKEDLGKLEKETTEKDLRLGELKAHVDQVRSQANAAYLHAKGFQMQQQYQDPMLSDPLCPVHGGGGGGGRDAGLNVSVDALRREVELEGQRVKDEQRRWKSRLEHSPARH